MRWVELAQDCLQGRDLASTALKFRVLLPHAELMGKMDFEIGCEAVFWGKTGSGLSPMKDFELCFQRLSLLGFPKN
jgi:hypothetical protein